MSSFGAEGNRDESKDQKRESQSKLGGGSSVHGRDSHLGCNRVVCDYLGDGSSEKADLGSLERVRTEDVHPFGARSASAIQLGPLAYVPGSAKVSPRNPSTGEGDVNALPFALELTLPDDCAGNETVS